MITAGELCNRAVVIAYPEDTVQEAARLMRDHHVGALVIVEQRADGKRVPVGVVTDRDLVVGVLARDVEHLSRLMIGDVMMSSEVVTAREEDSALDLFTRMRTQGVRRLPVVDSSGALVGIIAFDDLVGFIAEMASNLERVVSHEVAIEEQRRP